MPSGHKLTLALALLAASTRTHAQEKPAEHLVNVSTFSNRAVNFVAVHTARNPGAFLPGTERPINGAGKWSVRKYSVAGCSADAFACVAVLYTTPDKETTCEWTVDISKDSPSSDTIAALNPEAARHYLIRLSSDEAVKLTSTHKQPAFIYPALARAANASGTAVTLLTIDSNGFVIGVRFLTGLPIFRDSIEDTFKHWRFSPRLISGKPVASYAYAQIEISPTKQVMHFLSTSPPRHQK